MQENNIKKLLRSLEYIPKNGVDNVYIKRYSSHNDYSIEIDFNNQKINYGNEIAIGNNTTSNFSKPENFVVLECVNRLLEKGYKPQKIELEKIYPSGRGHSGNLDIVVYDENHRAYLMIECKTAGSEHNKEHNKMIKDGGQLFSYFALDRDAKYLCLYSSSLNDEKVEYKNDIIPVEEEWIFLSTSKEIHAHWNKFFKDNGIFEGHANPYEIKHKTLTYEMLVDLKETDSSKIFNQIMEILRHNVVSDKPNAFNKLLNLFVCKIIDENRNPTDELKFQWLEDDTDEKLQMRLNDLYKEGMWRFLNINVTDYSEEEINSALQGVQADDNFKQAIRDMFRDTRLKKSPNFAFKEVLDEKSFKANAKIVKEIVKLLQGYKFRYRQKHQFLGDFFELLLNTSMKQEAGQYFTPVPITRFIIKSLPIKELIDIKIKNNDSEILPVTIDYAAGSGHFLTEYMEQVQTIIDDLDISAALPTIKNKMKNWVDNEKFMWAKEYVYGIDLDDRLVKTAKVSAFFNGDGEANIIWANGLDNFEKSTEYIDKLKRTQTFDKKNNGQFDILISNPPYSVEAFKTTLQNGEATFELYNNLTDNSSEIECLFVERMKQLLKIGGWAGVVLPVSILSNSGIHSKAREIIFKYFNVKSITELGSGTFMKTGTSTIILFLERRADGEHKEIEIAIDKFLNDKLDVTVAGIEKAFSKFVETVYDDLTFSDYTKIIAGLEVKHELYKDYKKDLNGNSEQIKQLEKEKLLYFILTYNQEVVIVKTGEKQEEKKFLGYDFSERRGHEGLKWLPNETKLYNENNTLDKTKANTYIYSAFNGGKIEIDESLIKNISYVQMSSLFEYGTNKFDKRINLNRKNNIVKKYSYATSPLSDLANIEYGDRVVKNLTDEQLFSVYGGGGETFRTSRYNRENRYIISRFGMSPNCVRYVNGKFFLNDSGMTVSPIDNSIINDKYLNLLLFNQQQNIYAMGRGPSQKNIDMEAFKKFKVPLPPIDIQQKIIAETEKIENEYITLNNNIEAAKRKIKDIINQVEGNKEKFSSIATLEYGKALKESNRINGEYFVTGANGKIGMHNEYLVAAPCIIVGRKGSAGKVNYFTTNCYPIDTTYFVKPICDVDMKYLYYQINELQLEQLVTGIGSPGLNRDNVYKLSITLPPINKQKVIVAKIEECENSILKNQNKLRELENLKKNILNKYLQ